MASIGGWRGFVDSSVAATAFVLVRPLTGGLLWPTVVALAAGALVAVVRKAQGLSLVQAWSGFLGLGVSVAIVAATGKGEDLFLVGIAASALFAALLALSLVVGKPAVALGLGAVHPRYRGWRDDRPLRRACELATAFWALVFAVRAGAAGWVYQQPGDSDGTLLLVTQATKWPLTAVGVLVTVWLVRRAGHPSPAEVHARVEPSPAVAAGVAP